MCGGKKSPRIFAGFFLFTIESRTLFLELLVQQLNHLYYGEGNSGAGAEYCSGAVFVKCVIVLCRDNSAHNNHDVFSSQFLKLFNYLRYKCLVTCCKR